MKWQKNSLRSLNNNQARDTAQILQAISDKGYQEQIRELERDNLALSQRNQTTNFNSCK